ncbi:MAG: DUF2079 domain-containing protein, partial [Acidimicrobiia bacterium]
MGAAALSLALGLLAMTRVNNFLAWAYDLGFYIQDLFAIRTGLWKNTIFGFGVFSDHVSLVLVPLAYLTPSSWPGVFLVLIQAVAVGIALVPLYRLGYLLGGQLGAILAACLYASSAAVWHAALFDFHPVTLALPFGAWILLELEKGEAGRPWLPLIAMPFLREDIAILYGVVLLMAGLNRHQRSWMLSGGAAVVLGLGYFLIMRSQPGIGNHIWYRYGGEASDWLRRAIRPDTLVSLAAVLIPVLVVPALRGWRKAWPGLLLLLSFVFSGWDQQASLYYQYFAQAVPFLIAGSIQPIVHGGRARVRMSLVASSAILLLLGPLIYLGYGLPDRFATETLSAGDRRAASVLIELIPPTASVSATELLTAPVAWRSEVHPFPGPMVCGNSLGYFTPETRTNDFVLFEPGRAPAGPDWSKVLPLWGYGLVGAAGGAQLWQLEHEIFVSTSCPSWE